MASQYGGIYATHMRSESNAEMAALDETFRIGREAHIPVEIFHLKAAGKQNWGKAPQVIARIEAARASGLDVAADTYAYTAWENSFSAFIPPWAHDGGNAAAHRAAQGSGHPRQDPRGHAHAQRTSGTTSGWPSKAPRTSSSPRSTTLRMASTRASASSEIAKEWHEDAIDTICDFLIKDNAATEVAVFGMAQPDVELILQQPWVSIDNDASGTSPEGMLGEEHPHPRAYGTFPRILSKYVKAEGKLTLPDAIRKFSALPAQREHLTDRGVLKLGMWADVERVRPGHASTTWPPTTTPTGLSVGMQYVLVNGVPVIDGGKMTGALPGQVLLGPGLRKDLSPAHHRALIKRAA